MIYILPDVMWAVLCRIWLSVGSQPFPFLFSIFLPFLHFSYVLSVSPLFHSVFWYRAFHSLLGVLSCSVIHVCTPLGITVVSVASRGQGNRQPCGAILSSAFHYVCVVTEQRTALNSHKRRVRVLKVMKIAGHVK